ncbi:MAG: YbaK/EbsC family protein [Candidatus Howiella sp.]|jgi:prolyl-tRNA editing enzyme YbaK/EbsC (Cys-tRNA(Pro) deacylase)
MSIEKATACLETFGFSDRIRTFDVSSATVELAAKALNCAPERIAKTLSFALGDGAILIVAAGDAKVDNQKFKAKFGVKAKMLPFDEVEKKTGHAVGGVCPFGVNEGAAVYLDESLRRFDVVYPACGSANSAVRLTVPELEVCAGAAEWVDVCKGWQGE